MNLGKKNKIIVFLTILLTPAFSKAAVFLPNPISAESFAELIGNMIRGLLGIVGALALFYLVLGGITWMTSQGNADKVDKGKQTIVWAIFGLIMVFISYVLVNLVFQVLEGRT